MAALILYYRYKRTICVTFSLIKLLFVLAFSFLITTAFSPSLILDLIHRKTRSFYLFTWRKYCPLGRITFLNVDTFKIIVSFVDNVTVLMRVTCWHCLIKSNIVFLVFTLIHSCFRNLTIYLTELRTSQVNGVHYVTVKVSIESHWDD